MKKIIILILFLTVSVSVCQTIDFLTKPELFAPSIVSTEKTEVKITFSKDHTLMLWGTIGWENGVGGFDIWQSQKKENRWSTPQPVSFNSKENDFDPCFSSDGKFVYFFSNRPGGYGGDDIYYVQYDSTSSSFGEPVNMGSNFNTSGDEWGSSISKDGKKFIYCTDGNKGKGKHDIFICSLTPTGWSSPKNIDAINSSEDDFDPVFLHDSETIIFTCKVNEDEALLYISFLGKVGYSSPHIEENTKGRLDIYRIKYSTSVKNVEF